MTVRPRLADLCCKAGGAARGYHAAGFDVTGMDIESQPNFPYRNFTKTDVLKQDPVEMAKHFNAFHASPSCKGYTALRTAHNAKTHAREIPLFVDWLNATGKPWVLENVEDALKDDEETGEPGILTIVKNHNANSARRGDLWLTILCGSMFGLGAQGHRLERHRVFVSTFFIPQPHSCHHDPNVPVVGVYGGHARNRSKRHGGRGTKDTWVGGHSVAMAQAMGLPQGCMTTDEMSEAIPPAYAQWVGQYLMGQVTNG